MQVRKFALAVLVVSFVSATAFGQTSLRVSPTTFRPGDESFLTIFVSGLSTTDLITVTYSGPGGTESVEPSFIGPSSIIAWVPSIVMVTEGTHQVDVFVTRATGQLHYGPGFFDVELPDEEFPNFSLILPEVLIGEALSLQGGPVTYEVFSSDGTPVTCAPPSGANFPFGASSVSCTATNAANQTATGSFLVYMLDTVAPNVYVPADITTDNPVVSYTVTADDNIDPSPDVFCSPASGSTFPSGVTRVRCFAVDLHANFGFGEFTVTVTGGPPVMTLPDDIVAEATSSAGAVVTYTVTATENGVVSCTPASGSTFALGSTTVNCTAANSVGSTSGSFNVLVVDNTPPTLNLVDVTAEATSAAGAQVVFTPTAADLVDGSVPVTCVPTSGDTFPLGETEVQCTASDTRGNAAFGSFTVTVVDSAPPVITSLTASPNSLWPPNHQMVAVTISVTATDAVDPSPSCAIVAVFSNQPVNGTGDGDTAPDWNITGPRTVNLRSERAGNQDRIYTIKVQCTDDSGNIASSTVPVRVTQSRR